MSAYTKGSHKGQSVERDGEKTFEVGLVVVRSPYMLASCTSEAYRRNDNVP